MKNLIRFAVAGALMAGYATAQAQIAALPSTGSSDLWLFVSDQSAKTTFAEDTGISLSSLLPAPYTTGASLATTKGANFSVVASTALSSFLSSHSSDTLEWAVLGAQYNGASGPNDSSNQAPGTAISVYNYASGTSANAKVKAMTFGNNATFGGGLEGDLETINASGMGYAAGGQAYPLGNPNVNVWGEGTGGINGSTNLYGVGLDQSGIALNQATTLYGVTGNGNPSKVQSYILGTNLTLSSAGLLSVSTSPVPLPAAVWLFGSGLLGLIGVGRRKAAAV